MIQMTHILVLSQPEFLDRQVREAFGDQPRQGKRWNIAGLLGLGKRGAPSL